MIKVLTEMLEDWSFVLPSMISIIVAAVHS
jgi:hypothetical protein